MSSESGVVLNRYRGTYNREDKYSVSVDGAIKNKNMTEEAARCFAAKLSGDEDYVDATGKRSVIAGKTVVEQPIEEEKEDVELTLLESLVEQVAGQSDLIETARQENADKCDYIAETISVILKEVQDLASSIKGADGSHKESLAFAQREATKGKPTGDQNDTPEEVEDKKEGE